MVDEADRFAQKRVCLNCGIIISDSSLVACPECKGQQFKFLRDLPKIIKHCEFYYADTGEQCEADGEKVARDGKTYCMDHYKSSGRDLRDALRQAWLDVYAEFGDTPTVELTDEKIIQYFSSGVKQTRRTVAYGRNLREQYRKVMALQERMATNKIERAASGKPDAKPSDDDEEDGEDNS